MYEECKRIKEDYAKLTGKSSSPHIGGAGTMVEIEWNGKNYIMRFYYGTNQGVASDYKPNFFRASITAPSLLSLTAKYGAIRAKEEKNGLQCLEPYASDVREAIANLLEEADD